MALPYRALLEADAEVDHAAEYYELDVEGRGRRFLRAYFETLDHACEFAGAGFELKGFELSRYELRSFVVRRFPYTVITAISEAELVIVAVAHDRRTPGYWTKRLRDIER